MLPLPEADASAPACLEPEVGCRANPVSIAALRTQVTSLEREKASAGSVMLSKASASSLIKATTRLSWLVAVPARAGHAVGA